MAERLAEYDYRALGRLARQKLEADGRGWRVNAAEIGVTSPDLSRLANGQALSAAKVIAVCDWLQVSFRAFYTPATRTIEQRETPEMFHGKSTETERAAHHG
ncbi:hypothetical protein [Aminobacter niigataensis]|uniref:hypothetical protein n=1 Tax=Aminobacter niigataensis TaxID=83265 RepID=UPI0024CBE8FD|nr:hypothetical protein [Aminobacter niigataensis]CAI2936135.1 conserved protein of unknown function [Aminobacter niigataensis]